MDGQQAPPPANGGPNPDEPRRPQKTYPLRPLRCPLGGYNRCAAHCRTLDSIVAHLPSCHAEQAHMWRGQQVNLLYPLDGSVPGNHKLVRVSMTKAGLCPECGLEVANSADPEAVGETLTRHRNDFHDPDRRLLETRGIFPHPEQCRWEQLQWNIEPKVKSGRERVLRDDGAAEAPPRVHQQILNQQQELTRQQLPPRIIRDPVTNAPLQLPFPIDVPCGYGPRYDTYYCPFPRCLGQCASFEALATHIGEIHPYKSYRGGQLNLSFLEPLNYHYVTITERGVCPECGLNFNCPGSVSDEALGRIVQNHRRGCHHGLLLTTCGFKSTRSKRKSRGRRDACAKGDGGDRDGQSAQNKKRRGNTGPQESPQVMHGFNVNSPRPIARIRVGSDNNLPLAPGVARHRAGEMQDHKDHVQGKAEPPTAARAQSRPRAAETREQPAHLPSGMASNESGRESARGPGTQDTPREPLTGIATVRYRPSGQPQELWAPQIHRKLDGNLDGVPRYRPDSPASLRVPILNRPSAHAIATAQTTPKSRPYTQSQILQNLSTPNQHYGSQTHPTLIGSSNTRPASEVIPPNVHTLGDFLAGDVPFDWNPDPWGVAQSPPNPSTEGHKSGVHKAGSTACSITNRGYGTHHACQQDKIFEAEALRGAPGGGKDKGEEEIVDEGNEEGESGDSFSQAPRNAVPCFQDISLNTESSEPCGLVVQQDFTLPIFAPAQPVPGVGWEDYKFLWDPSYAWPAYSSDDNL